MTKRATPKAIAEYREKLLTNPASLLQNMRRTRETLRERSEQVFIDRDLTDRDKAIDEPTRKEELERLDEVILRVGARIDDLDAQIAAHIKAHPDAELAAKLMPQGPPGTVLNRPGPTTLTRQQRRAMERAQAKAEKNLPVLPPADSVPVEGEPEPTAEETPKAGG